MMSHHTSAADAVGRRRRLLALFAAVGAVLIVLVTIALYSMHRVDRLVGTNLARIDALTTMADNARVAQVGFKTQVQEWKNTLLRGHDTADFQTYHRAFIAERDEVRERLSVLAVQAKGLDLPAEELTRLDALAVAHQDLDGAYDRALAGFRPDDPLSIRAVDSEMRGLDRPINEGFDALVASVQSFADERRTALRIEIEQAIAGMRTSIYVSLAVGLVVLLLAAFVGMRATRPA
jgi:hypothetical protein